MTVRASFRGSWFAVLIGAAAGVALPAIAAGAQVAIIIDDLGDQHAAGVRALNLPGPVALAFLPNTRHGAKQAELAHAVGKEVLLHLPLEPGPQARAYPTAIRAGAGRPELIQAFAAALASVPHARGVNNHQGSLLTQLAEPMEWLMTEIRARDLYFIDSRTTGASVAYRVARAAGVPAAERSVFLDDTRGEAVVRAQFRELVRRALRDERAVGIGHPYPETLQVLAEELPRLGAQGVRLVSPSELIARQAGHRGPFKQLKLIRTLLLSDVPAGMHGVGPQTPLLLP